MSYTRGGHVFVLASALTHVHPGAGRSPGVVDLPVIRDPLGYPFIPGSSIKGALKSLLARKNGCLESDGRLDCDELLKKSNQNDNCRKICCLLGSEPRDTEKIPSRITITDLYPFLIPVPSLDLGLVFATSPLLLSRAKAIAPQGVKMLDHLLDHLQACNINEHPIMLSQSDKISNEIYLFTLRLKVRTCKADIKQLESELKALNPLYTTLGLKDRILVVPENTMRSLINKSLVRLTRVRIRRDTKTAEEQGLWTEEYIPHGTLFSGAILDTGLRVGKCKNDDVIAFLNNIFNNGRLDIIVGGKESIGKGLLRLYNVSSGKGGPT